MSGLIFTPHARLHLLAIWEFSIEKWGERRADNYLRQINTAIADAVEGRRVLRPRDEYGQGIKSLRSGSHAIYLRYDAQADAYRVIGVLHQHMDPPRHLIDEEHEDGAD